MSEVKAKRFYIGFVSGKPQWPIDMKIAFGEPDLGYEKLYKSKKKAKLFYEDVRAVDIFWVGGKL